MEQVGRRLLELVNTKKYRVEAIADAAGMSPKTLYEKISNVKKGAAQSFNITELVTIYKFLGASIDQDFEISGMPTGDIKELIREAIGPELEAIRESIATTNEYIAQERIIEDATIRMSQLRREARLKAQLPEDSQDLPSSDLKPPPGHGSIKRSSAKQTSSTTANPNTKDKGKK